MNNQVNASVFSGSSEFRNNEFEAVLECCVDIYRELLRNNCNPENNEEKIRDLFFEKLDSDDYREKCQILQNYHFESEPKEKTGFIDIKIKTLNPYISTKSFYCIECKKLGSNKKERVNNLNTEYVKNGICRFVSDYYSSYYGCNAMFGFLVSQVCVQTDIIDNINTKLNNDYTNAQSQKVNARAKKQLTYEDFANGYPYSYISTHTHASGKELVLYHLMFDFSNNIK